MARLTFLERQLLLQRLVLLGAEATTSAQRPRLRIVKQQYVPGFEGLCREDVGQVTLSSVVTGTFSRAYSRALVDSNVNMMQATFKPSFA